ncbi:hypothetical protein [Anaeromusa acidaminophila]|uniref:hypothetical protein n=1 Tax=Anaeromusa acidaminophila TaxID=81464 RepID=UPI00036827E1|nr:hypothetical protein [Anaeromusa acidaminophila]
MKKGYPNEQAAMNSFFTFLDTIIDTGKFELDELQQQEGESCQELEKEVLAKKVTYLNDFYKEVRREFTNQGVPIRSQEELQSYLDTKLQNLENDIIDILNRKKAAAIGPEDIVQIKANASLHVDIHGLLVGVGMKFE